MSGKLKEVKNRIESVKSTQQITKAMKLVAASKLKRATDAITQMRPYADKLSSMLSNIVSATEGDVKIDLAEKRGEVDAVLIVVVTSDKGLCGAFNTNVVKQAEKALATYSAQRAAGKVTVMNIGKKGYDALKKHEDLTFDTRFIDLFKKLKFANAAEAIESIMADYECANYDEVVVCYAEFQNAVVQRFQTKQILPIPASVGKSNRSATVKKTAAVDYLFSPEKNELINELVPKILKTQFYSFLLDSNASEHGARMTAMENATENAGEMLRDLSIAYNKERQAAITTELTEIVSGAAALGA